MCVKEKASEIMFRGFLKNKLFHTSMLNDWV